MNSPSGFHECPTLTLPIPPTVPIPRRFFSFMLPKPIPFSPVLASQPQRGCPYIAATTARFPQPNGSRLDAETESECRAIARRVLVVTAQAFMLPARIWADE